MKFKLDENFGTRYAGLLRQTGLDAATVAEEKLCSSSDNALITICRNERRCLITLDLDFANPFIFKPSQYAGIIVLRLPPKPTPSDIEHLLFLLIQGLKRSGVNGKLWIIQRNRIREYQEE